LSGGGGGGVISFGTQEFRLDTLAGNGFLFESHSYGDFVGVVKRAMDVFRQPAMCAAHVCARMLRTACDGKSYHECAVCARRYATLRHNCADSVIDLSVVSRAWCARESESEQADELCC
jgi:hypothetical protein